MNAEFFGVSFPSVAISNPSDGGNAWTAVQINVTASGIANPDYVQTEGFDYSIDSLNFFANGGGEDVNAAIYNTTNHTITYQNGGWHRAGWNWESQGGIDASAYNQVWIKFDASALPATSKLQFDVTYIDGSTETNTSIAKEGPANEYRANATEAMYNLTKKDKIKLITLKSESEGNVILTDAYFIYKSTDPVDLIVTDLTWTPANPVLGDSILFSATIKNISEFASQNVKHGVTFSVGTSVFAWSDTHLTALQPGEEVTVTANGGPNNGNGKWKPSIAKTYSIIVMVNDQNDVLEYDVTNNTFTKDISVVTTGIQAIASDSKVYAANGKLYLVNIPETAVISIYNVLSQKIGNFNTSEVSNLTLPKNLYIVTVKDGKKNQTFKVLVK
jgi:hypothetical protein